MQREELLRGWEYARTRRWRHFGGPRVPSLPPAARARRVERGSPRRLIDLRRYTDQRPAWVVAVALGAEHLATGSSDGHLRVWSVRPEPLLFERCLGGWIRAVAISGERVMCGGSDGLILFADLDGSDPIERQGAGGAVHAVAMATDASDLAVAASGNLVQGWSSRSGEERFRTSCHAPVRAVAFSQDGRTLAVGGADGSVSLLRTSDGMTTTFLRAPFVPRAIAFEAKSGDVVAASVDGRMTAWKQGSRRDLRASERPGAPAWNVTLSSAALHVAAGGMDGAVRVHDRDGTWVGGFEHGAAIRSLAFSADGFTLATGGSDGRAHLWSLASAEIGVVR